MASETRQLWLRVTREVVGVERDSGMPVSRASEVISHPRGKSTSMAWVKLSHHVQKKRVNYFPTASAGAGCGIAPPRSLSNCCHRTADTSFHKPRRRL